MPQLRRLSQQLLLSLLLSACGGEPSGDPDAGIDRSSFRDGSPGQNLVIQTLVLADSLFDFDPTLDPSATAEVNAVAIQSNVQANLDTCGSASLSGTAVTVDFGAAPGCTLTNGVQASGSLTASVLADGSSVTVDLVFTALVVNDVSLDGSASFSTTTATGSDFSVALMLTSGSITVAADLTVIGAAGSFTVDGTATVAQGATSVTLTFADLLYASGDCYPSGGTIGMGDGRSSVTVTFTAATAQSGEVTITQGRRSETETLPAYGDCPG